MSLFAQENFGFEDYVDPIDKSPLKLDSRGTDFVSSSGRKYRIVEGIPVFLVPNERQTAGMATWTLDAIKEHSFSDPYFLQTVGITREERAELRRRIGASGEGPFGIDPVVQYLVAQTNGRLYRHLVGRLNRYPIPELRLPTSTGARLLDIGCGWGRWAIAAARKGYAVTAIDPSLGAVLAGKRVARQMNLDIRFIVGDARYLPFGSASFEHCFSNGVLQHFSKPDALQAVDEISRVLKNGGGSLVQMANRYGVVSIYHLSRRRFSEGKGFEVRYWSPRQLISAFSSRIGQTALSIDGFFGLGIQGTDVDLLPPLSRLVIHTSSFLRKVGTLVPPLAWLADSLYVSSRKVA